MRKTLRRALFWIGVLYAVSLPLSFIAGGVLFARPVKDPVDLQCICDAMDPSWDRSFLAGVRQVDIQIQPRTRLRATVFGGDAHTTVIVLHESRSNRVSGLAAAYALWQAGYDVVLVDRRAHGSSDGEVLPLFAGEQGDLAAIVDRVVNEQYSGTARIGMFGIGDGGTSCLVAAALDPRIDAVVAEAPALTASDFIATKLNSWSHIPEPLLVAQTFLAVRGLCLIGGVSGEQLDATAELARIDVPTLILADPESENPRHTHEVMDVIPAGKCSLERNSDPTARYAAMVAFFDRNL